MCIFSLNFRMFHSCKVSSVTSQECNNVATPYYLISALLSGNYERPEYINYNNIKNFFKIIVQIDNKIL